MNMHSYEENCIPTTVQETQMYSVSSTSAPVQSTRGRKRKNPTEDGPAYKRKYVLTEEERLLVNAREKQRTKTTNAAFDKLKKVVPSLSSDKLTKGKTLDLAIKYIDFLAKVLKISPPQEGHQTRPTDEHDMRKAFAVWRIEEHEVQGALMNEQTYVPQNEQTYHQHNFM